MNHIAYVPIPQDLNTVKTKVLFNLTKRQIICFGLGAVFGILLFFLCKSFMNTSVAVTIMIFSMLPFMILAMYEKNGQPLEKIIKNIMQVSFLRPKVRPYISKNYYELLTREEDLYREVRKIAKGK